MNPASDRRRFLKQAALLPIVAAAGLTVPAKAAATVVEKSYRASLLKLSLNAFSFNDALQAGLAGKSGGVSLNEVLDFCAHQEFAAIDATGYYFPGYPEVPGRDFINQFKRRLLRLGLALSGTGIRNDFAQLDAAQRAADVSRAKAWIEAAAEMGAPVIRVFAGAVPNGYEQRWDEAAAWMIDAIGECTEHGRKHGVVVGVQNHGDMLKSAAECLKVMKAVNSEWCGLVIDTGNMLTANPYADIAEARPYAVNWQIKESIRGNDRSQPADLPRLFTVVGGGDYRGYVPIETLSVKGVPYDPFEVVPVFAGKVKAAMAG